MIKQKVAKAVIENGKIKSIDKKLPPGEIKVKLLYSVEEDSRKESYVDTIVRDTSGIYKNVNPEKESSKLRSEWDRKIAKKISR